MSRAIQELFCSTLWGTLEERKRTGLVRFYDTLAKTRFHDKYWMIGGLLLGCIRDGQPMAYDTDVDFSFWESDLPLLSDAIDALRSRGFSLRPHKCNNDGSRNIWAFKWHGVKFEFYMMRPLGHRMRWLTHARKPNLELVCEVPMHGLTEIELYGRRWLKPDDHETYLRSLFGDWRTPDPDYCYWTDSKAVVQSYSWTGRAA